MTRQTLNMHEPSKYPDGNSVKPAYIDLHDFCFKLMSQV